MRIYDYLKPLGVKVGLIKDYIVERKTIDDWDCEVWASGKKVARTDYSGINTGSLSASGVLFYKNGVTIKPLPTGFFKTIETISGQGTNWSVCNVYFVADNGNLKANVSRALNAGFPLEGSCVLEGV